MPESQTSPKIVLVNIDEDDEQRIRDLLDGAVKDEVIVRV